MPGGYRPTNKNQLKKKVFQDPISQGIKNTAAKMAALASKTVAGIKDLPLKKGETYTTRAIDPKTGKRKTAVWGKKR